MKKRKIQLVRVAIVFVVARHCQLNFTLLTFLDRVDTKRFRGLAKEEHDRGSCLVALNQWSRSIWRRALTSVH